MKKYGQTIIQIDQKNKIYMDIEIVEMNKIIV